MPAPLFKIKKYNLLFFVNIIDDDAWLLNDVGNIQKYSKKWSSNVLLYFCSILKSNSKFIIFWLSTLLNFRI